MKKILGYILAVVGLIGVAIWAVPQFFAFAQGFIQGYANNTNFVLNPYFILVPGIILAIIGVLIITKFSGGGRRGKVQELPIYAGNDVVGFRMHKQR